jgi:glutathione S-transferase
MLPLFKHFTNFAALADKFPGIGYVDMRHSRPPTGDFLQANLGRFPLIQTLQGVSIGQSCAINYYVASICNLLGKNSTETALVLSFSAHVQV